MQASCYIKNINDGDFLFIYGKYDLSVIYTEDKKVFIKDNYPLDLDYCGEITRLQIGNNNLVNSKISFGIVAEKKVVCLSIGV